MIIIMLGGQARVGKTTLAKWISEYAFNQGYTPMILPFAAALKEEAAKLGYSKDTNPLEYREFCQVLGSEKRKEDSNYWVNRFRNRVTEIYNAEQVALKEDPDTWHEKAVIVDDCRYLNEVAAARDLRALTIFISPGTRKLVDHGADWRNHESEAMANMVDGGHKDYTELFNYRIYNEGTEEQFRAKCFGRFEEWFSVVSEGLVEDLCECEICVSSRQDRPPDAGRVMKEIIDTLNGITGETNDKSKRKRSKDSDS